MKPTFRDGVYQRQGSNPGLTVKDGMLINNRPDGTTGIQQAVQLKKDLKRADKISMYAQAVSMGNRLGDCCM